MSAVDLARLVRSDFHLCEQLDILERHGEGFETSPAPNRNGSHEDRVMATKPLPSQEALRQFLTYHPDTGKLFWNHVDMDGWTAHRTAVYSRRCAGMEAFAGKCRKGYCRGKFEGVIYQAHRIIWKMVHGDEPEQIDHINGVKDDNRLVNLRACTNAENCRNYSKIGNFTSRFRGVCRVARDNVWTAQISAGSRKITLGYFQDEHSAAMAYDAAAIKYHGDFAVTNFPARAILAKMRVQP